MSGKPVVQGVAVVALVLAGVAAPAAAQAKLEVMPVFASYYGTMTITDDADNNGTGTKLKHIPGAGFGGRLTYWFSQTLGAEASGTYAWSGVRIFSDDPTFTASLSLGGNILLATGRVLYRPPRSNFHLLGGLGVVSRSGEFWDFVRDNIGGGSLEKLSTVSGVLGFGARAAVTPKLALNVEAEAYIYKFDPQSAGAPLFNKTNTQVDVLVTIGVPLALMK